MSKIIGRLNVLIGADITEVLSGLDRAREKLRKTSRQMHEIGQTLTTHVTLPLAGIAAAAIKASADLETAMVGVAKTVDAPASRIAAMRDEFVRLSEEIPVAATELANIAAEAGQLGIQLENIEGFTEVVAGLRVATNLGEEAGTSLARLANIMGTSQDRFDRLGSTIVDLGNHLATTEAEIVDMALRIAGAGRQIGLTEAQVLSFAGALSSVGINAEAGGSSISRVMADMASAVAVGGEELDKFAAVAGVSAAAFARRFRTDAAGAIIAFLEGLHRIDTEGGNVFATLEDLNLAEIRVRDTLLRASNATELFANAIATGSEAWQQNAALTNEASKFYDRLAGRLGTLLNTLKNVTAELGDALRPAVDLAIEAAEALLEVVRDLVRVFAELPEGVRIVIAGLAALAALIGPLAVAIAGLATVLTPVITSLGAMAAILVPGGALLVGLGALAAVFLSIRHEAEAMQEAVDDSIAKLTEGIDAMDARATFDRLGAARKAEQRVLERIEELREKEADARGLSGKEGLEAYNLARAQLESQEEILKRIRIEIQALEQHYIELAKAGQALGQGQPASQPAAATRRPTIDDLPAPVIALADSIQEAAPHVDVLTEKLTALHQRTEPGLTALAGTMEGLAAAFASTLPRALHDAGDAFKTFAQTVIAQLIQLAARFLLFKAALSIFHAGPLAALFGESFLGFTIPKRAAGGPLAADQMALVGERGPELFVPRVAGNIVPNDRLSAGGPPVIRFDFSGMPPARDPLQAARDAEWQRFLRESARQASAEGFRFGVA